MHLEVIIIAIFIYSIINTFLYAIASIRHYPSLQSISLYMALLYPILALSVIFYYLSRSQLFILLVILSTFIILYLLIAPRWEYYDNPVGPVVQNNVWNITDQNTTYAPEPSPSTSSLSNSAGPCLADDQFGYTLGDTTCQGTIPTPTPTPKSPNSTNNSGGGNGGGGSSGGGVVGTRGGSRCVETELPPNTFMKRVAANFNFWCRFNKHDARVGYKDRVACQNGGAKLTCSPAYYNGFYKYGDSQMVTNTKCMPWDTNFLSECRPNTFIKKIAGNCSPGYGIGLCKIG